MLTNPDLLEPTPRLRLDPSLVHERVAMAFASGGAEGALDGCLERASPAPSDFDPGCFEHDLFLLELVRRCLRVVVDGRPVVASERYLLNQLGHPPSDPSVVPFRQAILAELASDQELRQATTDVFLALHALRSLLSTATPLGGFLDIAHRRLDVLVALRDAIDAMGAPALSRATSGLARVAAYGEALRSGEAYERLARLLELDSNASSLDVRLQVGFDGNLRGFEVVRVSDNAHNPFYVSPWKLFWQRVRFFFRGFRFTEAELVDRLVDGVFDRFEPELPAFLQLLGDLELHLAALSFRDLAEAHGLEVCLPELVDPRDDRPEARVYEGLFNPLLLGPKQHAVPCDVELARHDAITILTGPNSGGKTRFLQAIGFTQLLAQSGLFVPARRARLVRAEGMFVSLVVEASADQSEGRLGTELARVREVFERLGCGSLVLLDELCSGTNPSEGEEMFELVVDLLGDLEPQAFVSTHFLGLAARMAASHPGELSFLQVELDARERPTYRFVDGVATSSLARQTAARLGVTRVELEELVEQKRLARLARRARTPRPVDVPAPEHASGAPPAAEPERAPRLRAVR
jgi:DNA mismatch repair protein MutS2